MYPKRTEFIILYLEITCAYYILLDNRDLQSCQVGQGKDVAIITPAQSTFCVLSHQAFPRLASGLDSMWHTSTRGFWSKKNYLIWILIARQCVSVQYLECTALSYNKLGFKYPLPEHNREAFRQNNKPMKRPISVPEQSIRDLARWRWSEHLNVEMALKIKITAHPAKN